MAVIGVLVFFEESLDVHGLTSGLDDFVETRAAFGAEAFGEALFAEVFFVGGGRHLVVFMPRGSGIN
jgi:hypothetical protein